MTSQDKSLETIFETFCQQANISSLLVGSHSIHVSFKLGFMFQVVGTTFKTLILETNPFLVRTNGFTADLAFVEKGETGARDGWDHKYHNNFHLTAKKCLFILVVSRWLNVPKNQRGQGEIRTIKCSCEPFFVIFSI